MAKKVISPKQQEKLAKPTPTKTSHFIDGGARATIEKLAMLAIMIATTRGVNEILLIMSGANRVAIIPGMTFAIYLMK
jgi:hypothetical protein